MASIRSGLYKAARLLGDAQALRRGPRATIKRVERKILGRFLGRLINFLVGR
jgi:hypothetical protein